MTGSDLVWLAPWVIFAVSLAVVCARLLRARRPGGNRLHRISTRRRPPLHMWRRG
ncbi:MAG TPA: hypothetical protein VFO01_18560 [Trebonia sp.]|nr:hypothetical protein [Trebonia sp.]